MKGDFTRDTFRPDRRYSSVRMQQGRVQLDADWNEAEDIRLARERTEIRDIVGLCGAPIDTAGFGISHDGKDFIIGAGRLYVQGVLAENPAATGFGAQLDFPDAKLPAADPASVGATLLYLDVWEEHVTALEDSYLREVALNGPDTTTRSRVVWQVRAFALPQTAKTCAAAMALLPGPTDARLVARAKSPDDNEACTVKPGSSYKRLENQLYRVEVHKAGKLADATFKWSRDNGTVVSGYTLVDSRTLAVDQIGRDGVLNFQAGGWIEVTDRKRELTGVPGKLFRIAKVEGNRLLLDPAGAEVIAAEFDDKTKKVRRWDSQGAVPFANLTPDGFMSLEDGVQIVLSGTTFRTGDYWLVPARTVTGDVEWPFATPQPPKGIVHRRCPLAIVAIKGTTGTWDIVDCRNPFVPLADVIGMFYGGGDGQVATYNANGLLGLAQSPTVGVARGKRPVQGAKVQWTIVSGGGSIGGSPIGTTGPNGLVSCAWNLGPSEVVQQLRADLLDSEGAPTHIPIVFTATLPQATGGTVGCCRSIGVGGDYPTIAAALEELAFERKQKAICLCLMPGTHEWPDLSEKEFQEDFSLTITGLRSGSVLLARDGFRISGFRRFALSDLAVVAEKGFRVESTLEVDFEFVQFETASEFDLEGVKVLRVHDCEIVSSSQISLEDVEEISFVQTKANMVVEEGHGIAVMGGQRAEFERCVLDSLIQGQYGATLSFSGANRALVSGCDISARRSFRGGQFPGDVIGVSLIAAPSAAGPAGSLIQKVGDALTPAGARAEAKKLIGTSPEARAANADSLNALVTNQPLAVGRDGAAAIQKVAAALQNPNADQAAVAGAVASLRGSVSDSRSDTGAISVTETVGLALQLESGDSVCHIVDNVLRGHVALYGDPGNQRLGAGDASKYQGRIRQTSETWGAGSLAFSKNLSGGVFIPSAYAADGDAFSKFMESGTFNQSVFRTATFGENSFVAGPFEVLFYIGSLTGNLFSTGGEYIGSVIGRSASYVGNVADRESFMISATTSLPSPAGNISLSIG